MRKIKRICTSRSRRNEGRIAYLFLAPSLAGTAVFVLLPFMEVVKRSFARMAGGGFAGLENFAQVLGNQAFCLAMRNTLRFMVWCIPSLMGVSLLTAVLVRAAADRSGLFKTTLLLPMAIPVASVVYLWKLVFQPTGLLNRLPWLAAGPGVDFMGQKSAFYVLVFTYIWKNNGYDMILWLAGLDGIAGELYEAAKVDGAGAWQRFWYITAPGLKGTAFLAAVLSVMNSFKVFREAYLISGDYPHESIYMLQHLLNNWFVSMDIQKMSAASVLLEGGVLAAAGLWCVRRRLRRKRGEETAG